MRRAVSLAQGRRRVFAPAALLAGLLATVAAGCGKKAPPLPPLVRIPAQPGEMVAERRGDDITVSFVVPDANADRTRPANINRVEVYAITAPATVTAEEVRRFGERVAVVPVNPPAEPDETPRRVAGGVDQGERTSIVDVLDDARRRPAALPAPEEAPAPVVRPGAPLLWPPPPPMPARVYIALPVGGRRVGAAARALVPLVDAPRPPSRPVVVYDENALTLTWTSSDEADPAGAEGTGLLPARPISSVNETVTYHVYEVIQATGEAPRTERRLTARPVEAPRFVDRRVVFGEERCYVVRTLLRIGGLAVESDAAGETCVKLVDTFPPPVPTGLTTVPSDGAISLIWDPSSADDLAGYIVLRGQPGGTLAPITEEIQRETSFRDVVPSGTRAVYAVQAVDREGNRSEPSETVEDTAR